VLSLCQGRIVWIELADRKGYNKYPRPVIILTRDDEIPLTDVLVGVVGSHTAAMQNPRPSEYIEIPHHPARTTLTKLNRPTVAICTWIIEIDKSTLTEDMMGGIVSPKYLVQIIEKRRDIDQAKASLEEDGDDIENQTDE